MQAQAAEECTFRPQLNTTSERMVEVMQVFGRNPDFISRQQEYIDLQEHRRQMKAHELDSECTFRPDINGSKLVVGRSRHSVIELETPEERAVRLSFKDQVRMESKKQLMQEQYYSQFTHQPTVTRSAISVRVGPTPVDELVNNARGQHARERAKQAVEENERVECTFKPKINKSKRRDSAPWAHSLNVGDTETILRRVSAYVREREAKLTQSRAEKEYQVCISC
jgi:hypothetical protein